MTTRQNHTSSRTAQARRNSRRCVTQPVSARRAAQRRRPRMSRLLAWLLSALLGTLGMAHAQVGVNTLPMGGRVVVGSGSIQQGNSTLVITQATPKLGMDWQSFNIGSGALVEFVQPGADSVALNRVLGNSGSEIYGRLRANGQVFLVNPSGILFAPGSKVDVGGLVASTLDLSQQDFADGRYNFNANSATGSRASVVNQGELRANAGGYVALFGNRVDNQGTVQVNSGSVVLASGRAATVSISGSGLISAVVTAGDAGSVSNSGSLLADGGVVTMTAQSAEGVASSLVNNSGIIRANSLVEHNGEIWITGDDVANSGQVSARSESTAAGGRITLMANLQRGEAQVGGTLDASSAAGDGGFIETSGSRVKVADSARITTAAPNGRTGTWLIDPTDFTVAASGGDLTGAQLSTQLTSSNVTIASTAGSTGTLGNVNIADTVSWSANQLTLNAQNNISVTQAMSGTGTATLRLEFGQGAVAAGNTSSYSITAPVALPTGASFTTKQGSNGADVAYTVINTLADLQAIDTSNTTRSGNWALGADIDGSGAAALNNNTGYKPIGSETSYSANNTTSFTGRLDGLGHSINSLTISRSTGNYTGVFASATGASFRNLSLSGIVVAGSQYVGGLVGYAGGGTNLSTVNSLSGTVSAVDDSSSGVYAGGLVGATPSTAGALTLNTVFTSGGVSGNTSIATAFTGGVVGQQGGGTITSATSTAGVTATPRVANGSVTNFSAGGIAGRFDGTLVTLSTASGTINGAGNAGGLVGYFGSTTGSVSNSSASGDVSGGVGGDIGGLIGFVASGTGSVTNSSATGNVSGPATATSVGGLVGNFSMSGGLSNVTAGTSGSTVSGGTYAGGVIGYANSSAAVNNNAGGGSPFAFNGASVSGNSWAGGLVGYSTGAATYTNLSSSAPVTSAASAGGLIGYSAGLVTGGTSSASVTGGSNGVIGGLVGQSVGGVTGSSASGTVGTSGNGAYLGGLVGSVTGGSVTSSTASGNVTSTGTGGRLGGLVGNFGGTGSISGATASGTVQGGTSAGGLVGLFSTSGAGGNITASSATGDVSSTLASADVGGLIGYAAGSGTLSNSFARGNVSAPTNASGTGGLVGQFQMSGGISNSNAGASGTTVTGGVYTGGVVGYSTTNSAYVTDSNAGTAISFNGASVTGTTWVGGIVGYSTGTAGFTGLSSSAPVTGTGSAGGVVGYAGGLVSGSTSSAVVNGGNAYVGGVAGQATAGLSNSNATGAVTASTAGSSVGGLVGYVSGGSVANSTASGNVRNNATSNSNAGGLIGYMGGTGTSITDSQASGSVTGGTNVGGLAGYFTIGGSTGGNITNSSATGDVITTLTGGDIGGLVGYAASVGTMSGSFARGSVTAPATADTVGGLVGQFSMTGGLSNSTAGAAAGGLSNSTAGAAAVGNTAATTVSGGSYTGGVLGWSNVNTAFTTDSNAGTAITFNGASVSGTTWVGGLFGQSTGTAALTGLSSTATVTGTGGSSTAGGLAGYSAGNVTNSNSSGDVSATNNVGGLIGQAAGTGAILVSGSSATGRVSNSTTTGYVGGLIGYSTGPGISNSTATGNVSGGNYAGGLVGYFTNNNSIAGSRADGTVSGSPNAGGLVGYAAGTGSLDTSTATGMVTGTANNTGSVGGLVGEFRMAGGISGSRAEGTVSTGSNVGGLVGYSNTAGSISTSTVGSTSISGGTWVGGLLGYGAGAGTIDGITVNLTVSSVQHAGGLAGYNTGPINSSLATGNVTGGTSGYIGGLVGQSTGNITGSSASGTVSSSGSGVTIGGLVGYASGGSIGTSSASGNVSATNTNTTGSSVGGLVGYFSVSTGSITGSHATGDVTSASGNSDVGGLAGYASGTGSITDSYARGNVLAAANADTVGGLVGEFRMTAGLVNSNAGAAATGNAAATTVSGGNFTGGVLGWSNTNAAFVTDSNAGTAITFNGASVTGTTWVGGLFGQSTGTAALTGLSSNAVVTGTGSNSSAGGLAGSTAGNVTNASASGPVTATNYVGGLIGQAAGSGAILVSGSSATGTVSNSTSSGYVGGLIGYDTGPGVSNSTATGNVSGGNYAGGLVGYYSNNNNVSGSRADGSISGSSGAGGLLGYAAGTGSLSGSTATGSVTGTANNTGSVGGLVGEFRMAGGLSGSRAEGAVSTGSNVGGLVGYSSITGSITTSTVGSTSVTGGQWVGGLIGYAAGSGTIDGITVGLNVTGAVNAGGLAGYSAGLILNSSASGTVNSGASYAGGLVAYSDAGVRDSSATGSVTVTGNSNTAGGLAGTVAGGSVTGSAASGTVSQTGTSGGTLGGLLGYFQGAGNVSNSSATGNVSGGYYVGGLIGNVAGSGSGGNVSASTATGSVTTTQTGSVGGLVGRATGQGAITGSSASGSVSATSSSYTGGLVGEFHLTGGIVNSQAGGSGSQVSGATYTGGVVGYYNSATALVTDANAGTSVAFRGASVSGTAYAGGIVGYSTTTAALTGLNSSATVSATSNAGGIAGRAAGNVSNISASGAVSGGGAVGGAIGVLNGSGTVADSQATGAVSNTGTTGSAGGLIGTASMSSGTIGTSTSSGVVSGSSNAGGLVGDASSVTLTVGSSFNSTTATVTGSGNAGGVVGSLSNSSLSGAAVQRPVTGGTAGGAVGVLSNSGVTNSSSSAQVTGVTYAGGLVGYSTGTTSSISDSTSSAPVTANSGNGTNYVGGLLGFSDGGTTVSRTEATGNVLAVGNSANAGGLIGYMGYYYYANNGVPRVVDSVARGNVNTDASSGAAGGLIGYSTYSGIARSDAYGTVTALDSTGNTSSSYRVGGLVGYFDGYSGVGIASSNAYGNVAGRYYTGGLVGFYSSDGSITGSTAHGNVSGTTFAGGLVGYFSGSSNSVVSGSSATGNVSGASSYSGGLVGYYSASQSLSNVSASGSVAASGGYAGGLVGYIDGAGVSTGFASGNVSGAAGYAGGLVGYVSYTANVTGITDSRATGDVSTTANGANAGGLLGFHYNYYGTNPILNSTAEGNVSATGSSSAAGGLVGLYQRYASATGSSSDDIRGSFASGDVTGSRYAGGLVGDFQGLMGIRLSGATGNVTLSSLASSYAGGLVGRFYAYGAGAQIDRSWASGDVGLANGVVAASSTINFMGGLAGQIFGSNTASVALSDAYATGDVSAPAAAGTGTRTLRIGGLVGEAQGSLRRSYSTGAVSASGFTTVSAGGLVGRRSAQTVTVDNSFWATDSSGQAASDGGTGQTLSQLMELATYPSTGNNAWSIASTGAAGTTWRIYEGFTTPLLAELLTPASISLADTSKIYDGTTSFGNGVLTGSSGGITRPDLVYIDSISPNVGTYSVAATNIYSSQRGYDLSVTGSSQLSITPRPLTLAGVVADKVYDGTRVAALTGSGVPTGLVAGEDLRIDGSAVTAVFDTKAVGSNKSVTVTGYTLMDGVVGLASNYSIGSNTLTTASITPKPLTGLSFTATDRTYDGSTSVQVAVNGGALQGVISGDDVTPSIGSSATGTMADKNVGTNKAVTVSGGALTGADAGNYSIGGTGGVTVNISQRDITVNGLTADSRAYNANTNVTVRTGSAVLTGLVSGDLVQLADTTMTGQVATKDVDTAKAVTVSSIRLRGPDALNYRAQGGGLTVDITPANISWYAYAVTGTSRLYDGTATATTGTYLYSLGNDDVTLNIAQSVFVNGSGVADKNVAYNGSGNPTSKNIVLSGATLTGTDAHNYTLYNTTYTTSGIISPIPLSVTGVTAVDRVYDGTTAVTVNVANASVDLSRQIAGDDLGVQIPTGGTVSASIANKNVGTSKPVTNIPGLTLTGNDRLNYSLSGTNGVTVNIARKDLTATYTGIDRAYDGTNYAAVQASSSDIVAGDNVDFYTNVLRGYYVYGCYYFCATYTGTDGKNVGQNKAISITSDTLTGNDAANYTFVNATQATATASITPKSITAQFTGANKVYNGTADAQVTLNTSSSGIYSGDAVTATGTGAFADKNVAYTSGGAVTTKAVAVSGISLSGNDAFNYTLLNSSSSTTASITPKSVTLTGITPQNRSYDGTTTIAVNAGTVTSSGFITGDTVSVQQPTGGLTTGTVASKNVGSNKPVAVTGLSLGGTDAGNYSIDLAGSGLTVNIVGREITAVYTGINKVYDGGTSAQVLGSSADLLQTDSVGFTQSAIFTGIGARNVGTGKAISVSNITLSGTDAANYSLLNTTATASADITAKGITVTYTGLDRGYNGVADLSALVQGASNGLIAGDSVSFTQQAVFQTDGRAGNAKAVDVSSIGIGGANSANYTLINSTATTTANITRKFIGVTGISAIDRTYDGTTQVQISVGNAQVDTSAIVGQDQVTVTLPSGGITTGTLRTGKNAGQAKAVDVSGLAISGADAANYQLVGATGLTVNIAPRAVTASFSALDKIYDGSALAQLSGSSGDFLAIDAGLVGISVTGAFADKNAATSKSVSVTSAFLTGAERANYSLINSTGQTTASITRKTITPRYTGGTRVYDGTLDAVVSSSPTTGIVAGDQIGFSQTAQFSGADGKNVGSGKAVSVSSIFMLGTDAANYQLSTDTATTTASVTPKPITVSGLTNVTAQDRTYDGTRVVTVVIPSGANIVANSGDIVAGDNVSIAVPSSGTTTGSMVNKNVGTGKAVLVDGLGLSGTDSGNYTITGTAGITVNITPKQLTAVYTGVNRVYDGTTNAVATGSSADMVSGDALTISASGQFTGTGARNAGTNKAVSVTTASLSGADAANYSLLNTSGSTTASITPRNITPSFSGGSRVYDGTLDAPVTNTTGNFIAGDAVSLTSSASFADKDVAYTSGGAVTSKAVTVSNVSLTGADAANYQLLSTSVNTSATITPKPLVLLGLSGLTAVNRVYDGTRTVTVNINSTGGIAINSADIVGSDDVGVNAPSGTTTAGTVANKNAGTGKAVTVSGLTLTGADAGNYSIAATNGLSVDITPRDLTASYAAANKIYDGTTAATIAGSSSDILSGDSVTVAATGRFVDGKDVGNGKAVTVTAGRLTGADAINYSLLNTTASTSANITPRDLTATYTGGTSVYDGSTTATVTGTLNNLIANDRVVLGQTAQFTDGKNVGNNKPVAITNLVLSGADFGNYNLLTTSATTTASLTPRPLHLVGLTGVSASNRVYDGTTTVSVTVSSTGTVTADPADLVAGDSVAVNAPVAGTTTGTMLDKNVGTAKPVAVTGLSLTGTDAANYTLQGTTGVTVDITPRQLTASYAAADRVYDGSTAATITASSTDRIAGDNLTISAQGSFTGTGAKNAGSGKSVSVTGGVLSGSDAANYSLLNATGSTTATIVTRNLSITYLGGSRVYDGTDSAPVTATLSGMVAGDDLLSSQTAQFTGAGAKNVGSGKTVGISGISLSGADAANYNLLTTSTTTTGTITPRALTVSGLSGITAVDRTYDGSLTVSLNVPGSLGSPSGDAIAGDQVSVVISSGGLGAGTMLDKNVGLAKAVVLSGLSLTGSDSGNYFIGGTTGLTVNITPKLLNALFTGVSRVYDGTAAATVLGGSADLVAGDSVSIAGSGVFTGSDAKNVGVGKAISVTGASLSGTDAANYTLAGTTGSATADITPRTLTATYLGGTRVYDGSTTAPVTRTLAGLISGDAVTVAETAEFTGTGAKNVGSNKTVDVTGIALSGSDAGNYSLLANTASTTGSITPRAITVSGLTGITVQDRVYDGTTAVAVNIPGTLGSASADVVAGDNVTVVVGGANGAHMLDKNVGLNKGVVLDAVSLAGTDAGNYTISGTLGLTVNIAPRALTISGVTATDRVYDGLAEVAIDTTAGTLTGAISGDNVSLPTNGVTGSMVDKNVGLNKAVTVSGLTLAGSDLANYTVSSGPGLTVNITPRTLTPTTALVTKVYDGTTGATVTLDAADRVLTDQVTLSGSATYASRNAGTGIAVAISGITLAGTDAANYQLAATQLSATGTIERRALTLTPNAVDKIYGTAATLVGTAFGAGASELVSGETVGSVTLSSAGTAETADVQGSPYVISASNATGGTFDAANYLITYGSGLMTVRPRPVTVAANSRVLFTGDTLPALTSYGFSTSVDGLFGSDRLSGVTISPQGLSGSQAVGGIYSLQPTNAVFDMGNASNYALSYAAGVLLVLPQQPRVGDTSGGGAGGSGFAVAISPQERADALDALLQAVLSTAGTGKLRNRTPTTVAPLVNALQSLSPDDLALLLSGDSRKLNVPDLLKLPLFTFDPELRRIMQTPETTPTN